MDATTSVDDHGNNLLYGNTTNYSGSAVRGAGYVTSDPCSTCARRHRDFSRAHLRAERGTRRWLLPRTASGFRAAAASIWVQFSRAEENIGCIRPNDTMIRAYVFLMMGLTTFACAATAEHRVALPASAVRGSADVASVDAELDAGQTHEDAHADSGAVATDAPPRTWLRGADEIEQWLNAHGAADEAAVVRRLIGSWSGCTAIESPGALFCYVSDTLVERRLGTQIILDVVTLEGSRPHIAWHGPIGVGTGLEREADPESPEHPGKIDLGIGMRYHVKLDPTLSTDGQELTIAPNAKAPCGHLSVDDEDQRAASAAYARRVIAASAKACLSLGRYRLQNGRFERAAAAAHELDEGARARRKSR